MEIIGHSARDSVAQDSIEAVVCVLQQKVRTLEAASRAEDVDARISSGCVALDRLLPNKSFARGTLVEWLSAGKGSGAGLLAMLIARQACLQGGALVVMDREAEFHAPALARWGVDPTRIVLVRADNEKDELWALDQALRCRGVAAAWAALERIEARAFRRLQLAAEEGGSLGLLLRPTQVRGQPSWSDVQLLVQPQALPAQPQTRTVQTASQPGWHLRIERIRSRTPAKHCVATLEVDTSTGGLKEASSSGHETRSLHLVSQLAHPTARRRSARA